MTTAIKIIDLKKTFVKGVRGRKIEALSALNLEIGTGEVFGFIGSNGAGKSTTIKILVGLIKASSGQALIFDRPVSVANVRERIGYLSEHPQFYEFLSPMEIFHLLGRIRGMRTSLIQQRAEELLALVSLAQDAYRRIKGFSKGMVQRLGIAVALLSDPELLILDEPMSGLDPLGRHLVSTIIRNVQQQGKTIFFSTHIIPDIETLCDRVGILVRGHLKFAGSIHDALYPSGNRFEMTVQMPEHWDLEQSRFKYYHLLWRQQTLHRFEMNEQEIVEAMKATMSYGGNLVTLEPKRRSLEELFLQLTETQAKTSADDEVMAL